MPNTASQPWDVAIVPVPVGDFTCWTLDAAGQWVLSGNGLTVPQLASPAEIGVKAKCQLTAIILSATFKMRFTFISPSGLETVRDIGDSAPVTSNPVYTESKKLDVNELGVWQCKVEVLRRKLLNANFEVTDTWGPFPVAEILDGGGGDGGGGGGGGIDDLLTDETKKNLLIAAGIGLAAWLMLRE